jgi:hypothetical protein
MVLDSKTDDDTGRIAESATRPVPVQEAWD